MKLKTSAILLLTLLLVSVMVTPGFAAQKFGARAYGMGGAFTAVADDASAIYWNPAGLVQSGLVGGQFSAGLKPDSDLVDGVKDVMDAETPTEKATAIDDLESGEVSLNGMFTGNFKSYGLGLIIDDTFAYDDSTYKAKNKLIGQGAVSVGTKLLEPPLNIGALAIGANVKGIYGKYDSVEKLDADNVEELNSTATGYGIDVGALAKVTDMVNAGINIRNMTSSLSWDESSLELDDSLPRTITVGAAAKLPYPLGATIALDIEDTEGKDRIYHVGLEKSLFLKALSLRAGMYEPLDGGEQVITGGIGLNLATFHANLAMDSNNYINLSASAKF